MLNNNFTILPAIHLRNGEMVCFTQGDTTSPIVFHTDPIACARQWIEQGAEWLQVVNLDAGKSSLRYSQLEWQLNWQTGQSELDGGPLRPGCYVVSIPRTDGAVDTKVINLQ